MPLYPWGMVETWNWVLQHLLCEASPPTTVAHGLCLICLDKRQMNKCKTILRGWVIIYGMRKWGEKKGWHAASFSTFQIRWNKNRPEQLHKHFTTSLILKIYICSRKRWIAIKAFDVVLWFLSPWTKIWLLVTDDFIWYHLTIYHYFSKMEAHNNSFVRLKLDRRLPWLSCGFSKQGDTSTLTAPRAKHSLFS